MLFTSRQMRAYHQPDVKAPPSVFRYYGKNVRKLNMRACFVEAERRVANAPAKGGLPSRPLLTNRPLAVFK
jgi:hypothetical protein